MHPTLRIGGEAPPLQQGVKNHGFKYGAVFASQPVSKKQQDQAPPANQQRQGEGDAHGGICKIKGGAAQPTSTVILLGP